MPAPLTEVKVDYATGGQDAFDMLCAARTTGQPYDVLLLDWKMPGMSGLATARLIREKYPESIPILLLTAYDWSDIEQEAMESGVDAHIAKPVQIDTLKSTIRQVLDSRSEQSEKSEEKGAAHL